jgi:hypothetical protein
VPHIAVSLIADDHDIIFDDAWNLMLETGDYGRSVFAEDDDDSELDDILDQNVRMAKTARVAGEMAKQQSDMTNMKEVVCSDLVCH